MHRGVRILVVDDNADGLASMEAYLVDVGFNVATALDPIEALNVTAQFEPMFAILDIGLPGMDGFQLASALRGRQACTPRFIALSGMGSQATVNVR
jgi:DNA-binding response OmpR family regulator